MPKGSSWTPFKTEIECTIVRMIPEKNLEAWKKNTASFWRRGYLNSDKEKKINLIRRSIFFFFLKKILTFDEEVKKNTAMYKEDKEDKYFPIRTKFAISPIINIWQKLKNHGLFWSDNLLLNEKCQQKNHLREHF